MGIPFPGITAPMISYLEIIGGLVLIVGFLTRVAAILLAADMVGAVVLVHLPAGFFLPTGYEFALTLMVILIAVVLMGPGAFSVDHALEQRRVARI
jgi:putative oxidoreductase